jgi:hypothetical protein
MFPKTQSSRRCAALSSNRLEVRPSRRAGALIVAWLACAGTVVLAGVALPVVARTVICVALGATGISGMRRGVLAVGPAGVRAIEWDEAGWTLRAGPGRVPLRAVLAPGGYWLGRKMLFLRFRSANGVHSVLLDADRHDPAAFRRLVRRAGGGS